MKRMHLRSRTLGVAIFSTFCVGSALAEEHPSELRQALNACSTVKDPAERLACFDKLAVGAAVAVAPRTPVATVAPAAPVATAAPVAAASPAAQARAPESPEDFGLSGVQKAPRREQIQAITAEVVVMGHGANGRVQLGLSNGQSWELEDAADALLAVGNPVTIRRASLGSFLMTTPKKVTHRVRRVK
jgi:hypothetical protein